MAERDRPVIHGYVCVCERPRFDSITERLKWVLWHYHNCKPKPIVNLYLPEVEDEDE